MSSIFPIMLASPGLLIFFRLAYNRYEEMSAESHKNKEKQSFYNKKVHLYDKCYGFWSAVFCGFSSNLFPERLESFFSRIVFIFIFFFLLRYVSCLIMELLLKERVYKELEEENKNVT